MVKSTCSHKELYHQPRKTSLKNGNCVSTHMQIHVLYRNARHKFGFALYTFSYIVVYQKVVRHFWTSNLTAMHYRAIGDDSTLLCGKEKKTLNFKDSVRGEQNDWFSKILYVLGRFLVFIVNICAHSSHHKMQTLLSYSQCRHT